MPERSLIKLNSDESTADPNREAYCQSIMAVNQLKAGAALNYVVIGLHTLVGLIYTPYMLRMMGQSECR